MASIIKLLIVVTVTVCLNIALFRAFFLFKDIPEPRSSLVSTDRERITLTKPMVERFKGALSIPTVSFDFKSSSGPALLALIDYIEESFPKIHNSSIVQREIIANYSLLYTVKGTDLTLPPYMLCSHLDVAPAERKFWDSDPYKGTHKYDHHIYARGAIDSKNLLMGMLEVVEMMLKNGFKPKRSFMMAFGHDKKLFGFEGAKTIGELLEKRLSQRLLYVLDEGGTITRSTFPGVEHQLGFVGVAEKGYLTLKLSTDDSQTGQASTPPRQTAISRLATALGKFNSFLMPSFLGLGVDKDMFDEFACYATWPHKLLYANVWLFHPILKWFTGMDSTLNSYVRTSTAVTMIQGGFKENILPSSATAYVNHRVHPLHTIEQVINIDKQTMEDESINVEIVQPTTNPTPVSPHCEDCYGFQLVKHSILQFQPRTLVVPSLYPSTTDARWYQNLTDSIYRFSPIGMPLSERHRLHGHNERIHLLNYEVVINFYNHLIRNSNEAKLAKRRKRRDEL